MSDLKQELIHLGITEDAVVRLLEKYTVTPKDVMPFGKFAGKKFDDVPSHYWDWLRDQDWVQEKYPLVYAYMTDNSSVIDSEISEEETPF